MRRTLGLLVTVILMACGSSNNAAERPPLPGMWKATFDTTYVRLLAPDSAAALRADTEMTRARYRVVGDTLWTDVFMFGTWMVGASEGFEIIDGVGDADTLRLGRPPAEAGFYPDFFPQKSDWVRQPLPARPDSVGSSVPRGR